MTMRRLRHKYTAFYSQTREARLHWLHARAKPQNPPPPSLSASKELGI